MPSGFFLGGYEEGARARAAADLAEKQQADTAALAERVQSFQESEAVRTRATAFYNESIKQVHDVVSAAVAAGRDPRTIMQSVQPLIDNANRFAPAAGVPTGQADRVAAGLLGVPGTVEKGAVEGAASGAKAGAEAKTVDTLAGGRPVPVSPIAAGVVEPPLTFDQRYNAFRGGPTMLGAPPAATDPTMQIRPVSPGGQPLAPAKPSAVPAAPAPAPAPAAAKPPSPGAGAPIDRTSIAYPFETKDKKLQYGSQLAEKYQDATKNHRQVDDYYQRIKTAYDTTSKGKGVSDTAMIFSFIKMLDPTSTVSPGEQESMKNLGSYLENLKLKYFDKVTNSIVLPKSVRDDVYRQATEIADRVADKRKQYDDFYVRQAKKAIIDPRVVVPDYKGPKSDFENVVPDTGIGWSVIGR